jgi:hypothetical protein
MFLPSLFAFPDSTFASLLFRWKVIVVVSHKLVRNGQSGLCPSVLPFRLR